MALRFGTDGVRGRAYEEIDVNGAAGIGRAVARTFGPQVLLAADTRESSPDLVGGLAAGIRAAGGDVPIWLGVAPTPALAFVSAAEQLPAIMVTASHNPWMDNGIKVFGPGGRKLSDEQQTMLEAEIADPAPIDGSIVRLDELAYGQMLVGRWQRAVTESVPPGALVGLRVVLDAANGAASTLAGPVLANAGAAVELIAAEPNGRNINDACGSTHPARLAAQVVESGADVGIALDGDADRMVAVDHTGAVVDGDAVIALFAQRLKEQGKLLGDTVVVTVMTNAGFDRAMDEAGISVHRCGVGDRHVLEALDANGWIMGGEQSGHIVFANDANTGDGTLAAVKLLDLVASSGRRLRDLAADAMTALPQVLNNVAVTKSVTGVAAQLVDEIAAAEKRLGGDGRVLVRASGTEPVVRVMVEAADAGLAQSVCDDLSAAVTDRFGT